MTEAKTTDSTAAPNADAQLIRLCEALPALKAAFEGDLRDDSPYWPPYIAACEAISAAPAPQTLAGIIAKARAALADGLGEVGPTDFTSHAAEWAWGVAQALARLAPERAT